MFNKETTFYEKSNYLKSQEIDPGVLKYLKNKFNNLYIEILGDYQGDIFSLMNSHRLMGWCWQTTESAILFLNDEDYIERGYLCLDKIDRNYYHSWICFNYKDIEYVFDPCLDIICKKEYYIDVLDAKVKAKIYALSVKKELIKQINTPKETKNEKIERIFDRILGDDYKKYKEEHKDEVTVHANEDVSTPLYRNGAGYTTEIEDGLIKKIKVHYYLNG